MSMRLKTNIPTHNSCEVSVDAPCGLLHQHRDGFRALIVIDFVAADGPVSQHAHSADGESQTGQPGTRTLALCWRNCHLREIRWFEGRDQRSRVDGHDGDDDAGQEDGRQLVDIFNAHKHQQGHQQEADGAVNTHVVQHCRPFAFWVFCLENGRLWSDVHLEETCLVSLGIFYGCSSAISLQTVNRRSGVAGRLQTDRRDPPGGSRWLPGCTWLQRRSCPGRSTGPQHPRTPAPTSG